eukprot:2035323-Rhodomonas_salina.1
MRRLVTQQHKRQAGGGGRAHPQYIMLISHAQGSTLQASTYVICATRSCQCSFWFECRGAERMSPNGRRALQLRTSPSCRRSSTIHTPKYTCS